MIFKILIAFYSYYAIKTFQVLNCAWICVLLIVLFYALSTYIIFIILVVIFCLLCNLDISIS